MGFDCTLHLVNEQAIRDEFVPRLLGRTQAETALDRVVKDAAKNWDIVRNSLENGDPEEAASLVCQLAVMFSACSLPHQYERGFALCMWQEQGENTSVEYPEEFAFSPESLFAEVVAKYPSLAGRFPTWFAGNYSTGVYIPSDHVSEVLAWAEKVIANFKKGDQRKFKGLLRILRAAGHKQSGLLGSNRSRDSDDGSVGRRSETYDRELPRKRDRGRQIKASKKHRFQDISALSAAKLAVDG